MSRARILLHVVLLETIDTPSTQQICVAALSLDEKRRAESFAFERQRRQYICAHGLLRFALSSFAPEVKPSDWCFITNRYGRPFVASATPRTIYFSLSHTEGCLACAVSNCEAVGVDVEKIQERSSLLEVAYNNFSPDEIDALRALPPGDQINRFYEYWTLKEAYLKARGTGLSSPLDQFSILISPGKEIGIRFAPGQVDPHNWRFTRIFPSERHALAVAEGSGQESGLPIVVRNWPSP